MEMEAYMLLFWWEPSQRECHADKSIWYFSDFQLEQNICIIQQQHASATEKKPQDNYVIEKHQARID